MRQSYLELYEGGQGELTEKRSRFIATVRPVKSEEEAAAFIEETRKKYWDANHNCTAFSIGLTNPQVRCSDDGEPGGTAGRPMLDVLLGKRSTTYAWWSPGISGEPFWGRAALCAPIRGRSRKGLKTA